jgi:hypothetical protein
MKETLRSLTAPEVLERIKRFNVRYVKDWDCWLHVSRDCDFQVVGIPFLVASEFRRIMWKWRACRPKPYRSATDLQSTLDSATEPLKRMGSADLRSLQAPSGVLTDAICGLWRIFEDGLCSKGKATEVVVSKAILLVTKGRIGPAFDSNVKTALNAWYVKDCGTYIKALGEIASQLAGFEDREGTTLDDLAKQAGRPADVGRALDMVLGPRGRDPSRRT